MNKPFLRIHPNDNILAALKDLAQGEVINVDGQKITLLEDIPSKHKFTISNLEKGEVIKMYGVMVGKASQSISPGCRIQVNNTTHAASTYGNLSWNKPEVTHWKDRTFNGYHRANGQVGTQNTWLVIPLVFCENRNVEMVKSALEEALGYAPRRPMTIDTGALIKSYKSGASNEEILSQTVISSPDDIVASRIFPNVDGIKFLTHQGGCGGTREDSEILCRLLAGYINHPNVAGATILSLGCQNAQIPVLKESINRINPDFEKPLYFFEQQDSTSEAEFISDIVKHTFVGLIEANKVERKPA